MNSDELRAIQAPLKLKYRGQPESALVTSRVKVDLDPEALTVRLAPGRPSIAGLHPATGGTAEVACSADMLLEALAACAGVTLLAVATSSGVVVTGGRIVVEGLWDARGTLAVDKTVPVGIQSIKLSFELESSADPAARERLIRSTERYCVILGTLRDSTRVEVSLKG
ncbi:MAG: OsmC family protein [Proteobacteria bacterium]|nr:OsmC family protein [Pseudomonadota bacterium]